MSATLTRVRSSTNGASFARGLSFSSGGAKTFESWYVSINLACASRTSFSLEKSLPATKKKPTMEWGRALVTLRMSTTTSLFRLRKDSRRSWASSAYCNCSGGKEHS